MDIRVIYIDISIYLDAVPISVHLQAYYHSLQRDVSLHFKYILYILVKLIMYFVKIKIK